MVNLWWIPCLIADWRNPFISEALASILQLPGKVTSFNLSIRSQKSVKHWKAVLVHLSPERSVDPLRINTHCLKLIVQSGKYRHVVCGSLKSAGQCGMGDLLNGLDTSHLLMPLEARRNCKFVSKPYAVCSYFGWGLQSAWLFRRLWWWCVYSLLESWETGGTLRRFDAEDSF